MKKSSAYIIQTARTPIGNIGGSLAHVRTDDLAAIVIKKVSEHPAIDLKEIADVIIGCSNQAGEDNRNVARMASLLAGLPVTIPGETVNRLCASGMSAAIHAARGIMLGEGSLYIAGGVESMTRGPWVISKASSAFGRDAQMFDTSFGWRFVNPNMKEMHGTHSMGETAENVAIKYNISREDQDAFAFWSQTKAAKAQSAGRFKEEITAVEINLKKGKTERCDTDEFLKPGTTVEALATLRPAFRKDGSVTAGNASGLNDGAAAMLMASEEAIKNFGLKPLSRIVASAVTGVEPAIMGIGPVTASRMALQRAGLNWNDIDIIELNEAFAAQSLACIREWDLADDDPRINPNGGAIALGHPLGMSGTRLLQTASLELQKQDKRYALCTMCIGVGQGYAVIIEKC
jgi:3-oxoadipyl-CoA thiolase